MSLFSPSALGGTSIVALLGTLVFANPPALLKFVTLTESKAEYDRVVAPYFAKNCQSCHNDKKSEGDLVVASLDPDMKTSTSGARWAMLVEKL